jgi:hypothetical protein
MVTNAFDKYTRMFIYLRNTTAYSVSSSMTKKLYAINNVV